MKWLFEWLLKKLGSERGETNVLIALIVSIVLIFVGLEIVATIAPLLGNITYTEGGIGGSIFDIAVWLVPVLATVGLIAFGVRKLIGRA